MFNPCSLQNPWVTLDICVPESIRVGTDVPSMITMASFALPISLINGLVLRYAGPFQPFSSFTV